MLIRINGKDYEIFKTLRGGSTLIPDLEHPLAKGGISDLVAFPSRKIIEKAEYPIYEIANEKITEQEIEDLVNDPWQIFRPKASNFK